MTKPISYSDAGVSIDQANLATTRIKELARRTFNNRTLTEIGSFGGMFDAAFPAMRSPVLVASADGVGTKLKLAFATGIHNTIGADLVNHCTNDVLVQGARPLFFMDYFAAGKLAPETTVAVVEGVSRACLENKCVLLGGETAEMPGFYPDGEYDLAGFIVGIVDRELAITGERIVPGDIVIGLPSTGLHTNGYSLARKLLFEVAGHTPETFLPELGSTVGEILLATHKSYLEIIDGLIEADLIKGMAHITGGGLLENIPRILPANTAVHIKRGTWKEQPIFDLMQRIGWVKDREMFRTFNMGVGMILICAEADVERAEAHFALTNEEHWRIGRVVEGKGEVRVV